MRYRRQNVEYDECESGRRLLLIPKKYVGRELWVHTLINMKVTLIAMLSRLAGQQIIKLRAHVCRFAGVWRTT